MRILPTRVTGYFEKHHRAFPYIGLTIVFLTAVVREGFGEHWRQLAGSIDLAQYVHAIRTDTSKQNEQLAWVTRDVRTLAKKQNGESAESAEDGEQQIDWVTLQSAESSLSTIGVLVEKLPGEKDLVSKQEFFKKQLEDAHKQLISIQVEHWNWNEKEGPEKDKNDWTYRSSGAVFSMNPPPGKLSATTKRYVQFENDVLGLQWDLTEFGDQAISQARQIKKQTETREEISWVITALFVVGGFIVGLLGKRYNKEESEGTELDELFG